MKVLLLGATGMVGQGRAARMPARPGCRERPRDGRSPVGQQHAKLGEIVRADLFDLTGVEERLRGLDACFFCLGVSSAGMSEADYRRITLDLTLSVARDPVATQPRHDLHLRIGRRHRLDRARAARCGARVKGETENALLRLPIQGMHVSPGLIQPLHGIRSKTPMYRVLYAVLGPADFNLESRLPQLRHNHRTPGARDARSRRTRRAEARARNPRHQRARGVRVSSGRGGYTPLDQGLVFRNLHRRAGHARLQCAQRPAIDERNPSAGASRASLRPYAER